MEILSICQTGCCLIHESLNKASKIFKNSSVERRNGGSIGEVGKARRGGFASQHPLDRFSVRSVREVSGNTHVPRAKRRGHSAWGACGISVELTALRQDARGSPRGRAWIKNRARTLGCADVQRFGCSERTQGKEDRTWATCTLRMPARKGASARHLGLRGRSPTDRLRARWHN